MWELIYSLLMLLFAIWILLSCVNWRTDEKKLSRGSSEVEEISKERESRKVFEKRSSEDSKDEEISSHDEGLGTEEPSNEEVLGGRKEEGNVVDEAVLKGEDIDVICNLLMKSSFPEDLKEKGEAAKEFGRDGERGVGCVGEGNKYSSEEPSEPKCRREGLISGINNDGEPLLPPNEEDSEDKTETLTDDVDLRGDITDGKTDNEGNLPRGIYDASEITTGTVTFEDSDNEGGGDESTQIIDCEDSKAVTFVNDGSSRIETIASELKTEVGSHQRKMKVIEISDDGAPEENVTEFSRQKRADGGMMSEASSKKSVVKQESTSESYSTSSEQVSSTVITKVVNMSYTTEEFSTESVGITIIDGVPQTDFEGLTDSLKGNRKVLKETVGNEGYVRVKGGITESSSSFTAESVKSENVVKEVKECEFPEDENTETQRKVPACGVYLFGGEELMDKIKKRRIQIEGGEESNEVKTSTTESNTCTTLKSQNVQQSFETIRESKTDFTELTNKQIFTVDAVKKSNIRLDNIISSSEDTFSPTPDADSLWTTSAHFEPLSDKSYGIEQFHSDDGEMGFEVPLPHAEPLTHLNKSRPKGPIRRRIITASKTEG